MEVDGERSSPPPPTRWPETPTPFPPRSPKKLRQPRRRGGAPTNVRQAPSVEARYLLSISISRGAGLSKLHAHGIVFRYLYREYVMIFLVLIIVSAGLPGMRQVMSECWFMLAGSCPRVRSQESPQPDPADKYTVPRTKTQTTRRQTLSEGREMIYYSKSKENPAWKT